MPVKPTPTFFAFGFEEQAFSDTRCASSRTMCLLAYRTRHWANETVPSQMYRVYGSWTTDVRETSD